jgi:hypothetical protein
MEEEQDWSLAGVIAQSNSLAANRRQLELGRLIANLQAIGGAGAAEGNCRDQDGQTAGHDSGQTGSRAHRFRSMP